MTRDEALRLHLGITTETRSLAEVEQYCEVCGKLITPATSAAVRWPQWSHDNRAPADFRPHELHFAPFHNGRTVV